MSMCGSCPLYWAETNGLPKERECPGSKDREECVDLLLDYISDLQQALKTAELKIADNEWSWYESERDVWMSQHEWPRGITWAIIKVQVKSQPTGSFERVETKYEVNYMRTDIKNFTSKDVWQDKIRVKMCRNFSEAKDWIYENHMKYPED